MFSEKQDFIQNMIADYFKITDDIKNIPLKAKSESYIRYGVFIDDNYEVVEDTGKLYADLMVNQGITDIISISSNPYLETNGSVNIFFYFDPTLHNHIDIGKYCDIINIKYSNKEYDGINFKQGSVLDVSVPEKSTLKCKQVRIPIIYRRNQNVK